MACKAIGEEPAQDNGGAGGEVAGEGGVAAPAGVDEDSEIAGFLRDLVGGEEITSTYDDHPDAGQSENVRVCPGERSRSWPWQPTRTAANCPGPLLTRIVWSAMLRVISWSR
jgi:hypothetical protein